jgi:response regulator RpfG family c-di-GMP phosphodiesterase
LNDTEYTCLVVDDNPTTLTMLTRMLATIGYHNVVAARNGKEAWQIVRADSPRIDIVLSDMIMPEEDGLQLLRHIRSSDAYWQLPFIMITCVSDFGQIMSVTEEHIDAYLVKPVTETVLRQKIHAATKRAYAPDPYHHALLQGQKAMRAGQHEMALHALEEARALQPEQSATYFHLAQVQEQLGDLGQAAKNYTLCRDCSNDLYVRSLDGLARIHQQQGDHARAMAVLKKAVEISPNIPDRHLDLAVELQAAGQTTAAKSALAKALKLTRAMATLPRKYIETCLDLGMETEAMALMEQSKGAGEDDIIFLNKMGIICRQRKEFGLAKKNYERALKCAPDDETLNYNFALLLVDMRDFQTARKHLYHILKHHPDSEKALALIIKLDKNAP